MVESTREMTESQKQLKEDLEAMDMVTDIEDWPGAKSETSIGINKDYVDRAIFHIIGENGFEVVDIHIHPEKEKDHHIDVKEQ